MAGSDDADQDATVDASPEGATPDAMADVSPEGGGVCSTGAHAVRRQRRGGVRRIGPVGRADGLRQPGLRIGRLQRRLRSRRHAVLRQRRSDVQRERELGSVRRLHGASVRRHDGNGVVPGRVRAGRGSVCGERPRYVRRDRHLGRHRGVCQRCLHGHAVLGHLHGRNVPVLGQRSADVHGGPVGKPRRLRQPGMRRCERRGVVPGRVRAERDELRGQRRRRRRRRADVHRLGSVGTRERVPVRVRERSVRRTVRPRADDVLGQRRADLYGERTVEQRRRVLESGLRERGVRGLVHARDDHLFE